MHYLLKWDLNNINSKGKNLLLNVAKSFPLEKRSIFHKEGKTFLTELLPLNPFIPSGFFYFNSLDRFIFYIRGVWLVFIIFMFCRNI